LELLAELILGALKPEDEDRFAESAVIAETALSAPAIPPTANTAPQAASQENPLPAISAPEVQIEPLQPQSVNPTTPILKNSILKNSSPETSIRKNLAPKRFTRVRSILRPNLSPHPASHRRHLKS
jgi:hypothetical protein